MSSGKKRAIIVLVFLMLLALPAGVYMTLQQQQQTTTSRAANGSITFDQPSLTKNVGDVFSLTITINTGATIVTGAEIAIKYDSQYLQQIGGIQVAPSPFLPLDLTASTDLQGAGRAFIRIGAQGDPNNKGNSGQGTVGTITFKALAQTQGFATTVSIVPSDTKAVDAAGSAVTFASPVGSSQITINIPVTPTVTPLPTVAPSPIPTAIPTQRGGNGGGGIGGSISPTPTRFATGSATPTSFVIPSPTRFSSQSAQPTTGKIPITADTTPTMLLTIGGAVITILGITAVIIL